MSTYSALAAILGGAMDGGATLRAREEEARIRKMQEDALRRQTASQNYEHSARLAPGLLASNPQAAAEMANASMAEMKAAGFNVPNAPIQGGLREVLRPSATPTGGQFSPASPPPAGPLADVLRSRGILDAPLNPDMSFGDVMTQGLGEGIGSMAPVAPEKTHEKDFGNSQTRAAVMGAYGLTPTKGDWISVGSALYSPSTGKWEVPPTQLTATDKKQNMEAKIEQAMKIAKDKAELALLLKQMGISATHSDLLIRLANRTEPRDQVTTVTLDDGVYEYNKTTGKKTRIGDRPKRTGGNDSFFEDEQPVTPPAAPAPKPSPLAPYLPATPPPKKPPAPKPKPKPTPKPFNKDAFLK